MLKQKAPNKASTLVLLKHHQHSQQQTARDKARSQHNILVLISLRNLNPAGHQHQFNLYAATKWPQSQCSLFQPKHCYNRSKHTLSSAGKGWQNKNPHVPNNSQEFWRAQLQMPDSQGQPPAGKSVSQPDTKASLEHPEEQWHPALLSRKATSSSNEPNTAVE